MFRRNVSPPSSGSKISRERNQRVSRWVGCLIACWNARFLLSWFTTLKMKLTYFSEKLVHVQTVLSYSQLMAISVTVFVKFFVRSCIVKSVFSLRNYWYVQQFFPLNPDVSLALIPLLPSLVREPVYTNTEHALHLGINPLKVWAVPVTLIPLISTVSIFGGSLKCVIRF
jgi:hypothetical protein